MIQCLDKLKQFKIDDFRIKVEFELEEQLDRLTELCRVEGSGNAAIATRNGALELVSMICSQLPSGCAGQLSALNAMALLLHGMALVREVVVIVMSTFCINKCQLYVY